MQTVKTDSVNVTLTIGEHLQAPHLPEARLPHVSMLPIERASAALVDVKNRRVVWLSTDNKLCCDPRVCGGKVKDAIKAYQRCYGVTMQSGSDAPGEDRSGLKMITLQVRDGVVTSHQWTTQKQSYHWDWAANKQVTTQNGWKYDGGEYKGTTANREMRKALS